MGDDTTAATAVDYEGFVARKLARVPPTGLAVVPPLGGYLFPFQRDLVAWALRRGRAALFASTGLGKSRMQLEWARCVHAATGRDVLILAPLAVAPQTAAEGAACGIAVAVARADADVRPGITVTNYDRLHRFDPARFGAVVLDESSCIKHNDSKTLRLLMAAFASTPFRLAATATPAPNDWTELATHAEFLGVCSRAEMLAEYFCHDGGETQKWRLKGHARAAFWRWVASWAALVRHPRDLGHDEAGYDLPPLTVTSHELPADPASVRAAGLLFAEPAATLMERRAARRGSLGARVGACVDRLTACACAGGAAGHAAGCPAGERWIVWCELNDEQDALADALGDACVSVYGSLDPDEKEDRLAAFVGGAGRVLVSKPSVCGFGLNLQSVARVAFVGVTDSWEAYHQAVRRCWRFGQTRAVEVHVYASELEGNVVRNLARKEADAAALAEALAAETRDLVRAEVGGAARATNPYAPAMPLAVPGWLRTEDLT